jgi:hypothetical protein
MVIHHAVTMGRILLTRDMDFSSIIQWGRNKAGWRLTSPW